MTSQEWNQGKLLQVSGAYWQTCTLHAAVKMDVFSRIGKNSLAGNEIADKLNMPAKGIIVLLDALSAMGLLNKRGNSYANTKEALAYLSKTSEQYIGYMILHHHHLADSWVNMDKAFTTGGPIRNAGKSPDPKVRESFLMGMFNIAMAIAPGLAQSLDLSKCNSLLDLGGGPGTFAIQFCLHNPQLEAVVCDLPTTRPFAEKTIQRFKVEDRVSFKQGDYTKKDFSLGQTFDAAWLSHILHGEGPETAQIVIDHTVAALNPGGRILIHDFILEDTKDAPLFPALFSINMFIGTEEGRSYSQSELIHMLESAGVYDIARLDFKGPTESGILTGLVS